MRKKIYTLLLISVFTSFLLISCGKNKVAKRICEDDCDLNFTIGEIKDHTYTNDFFRIRAKFPNDWSILNKEEMEDVLKTQLNAINDKTVQELIDYGNPTPIMIAQEKNHKHNINITISALANSGNRVSVEDVINAIYLDIDNLYTRAGYKNIENKKEMIDFLGDRVAAIKTHAFYGGKEIYQTQVFLVHGFYYAVITSTSFDIKDDEKAFTFFQKIKG